MKRVMVLVGGRSSEREISLKTGTAVASALQAQGFELRLLDTGRPEQPALPLDQFLAALPEALDAAGETRSPRSNQDEDEDVSQQRRQLARRLDDVWRPDLVFIALHGGMGEDGTVQALLDWMGLPYTGCGMAASALAMDKMTSKRLFRDAGMAVPEGFIWRLPNERRGDPLAVVELTERIEAVLDYPVVIKPNREGSSVGLAVLHDRQETSLTLPRLFELSSEWLAEEFIPGREITASILDGDCLPLVEILPAGGLYDFEHKYSAGKSNYECPADLDLDVADRIEEEALLAWEILGCRHLARVDFRLAEDGTPYCLELNSIPGMTETSLFPMAASLAGLDFGPLVAEIARLALEE